MKKHFYIQCANYHAIWCWSEIRHLQSEGILLELFKCPPACVFLIWLFKILTNRIPLSLHRLKLSIHMYATLYTSMLECIKLWTIKHTIFQVSRNSSSQLTSEFRGCFNWCSNCLVIGHYYTDLPVPDLYLGSIAVPGTRVSQHSNNYSQRLVLDITKMHGLFFPVSVS